MSTVLSVAQRPGVKPAGFLRRLGLIGFDALEPVVLAALVTETPLLIIGKHGTAKSLLLCRLSEALGLSSRHYNASLINYDDLVGYPLPDPDGKLRFVETPASIWDAQTVFIDEISRARPDMQNRLFPIVHERKVQGIPLTKLRYRWSAMNPPVVQSDADAESYQGSEPLDPALADRFGFVIEAPEWSALNHADRDAIITSDLHAVSDEIARELRDRIDVIRAESLIVEQAFKRIFTQYVREIFDEMNKLGMSLSGRRSAMLYRNLIAIHAARICDAPVADPGDSAWIALSQSLPQRACGVKLDTRRLLVAHNSLWKVLSLEADDPRRLLALERDPVRRGIRATAFPSLERNEVSAYVADAFAELPAGGRHAFAHFLIESGRAGRLLASVAQQAAELYAISATRQDVKLMVSSGGNRHETWLRIVSTLASLPTDDPETDLVGNLLSALFNSIQISTPPDVEIVVNSWRSVRALCGSHLGVK